MKKQTKVNHKTFQGFQNNEKIICKTKDGLWKLERVQKKRKKKKQIHVHGFSWISDIQTNVGTFQRMENKKELLSLAQTREDNLRGQLTKIIHKQRGGKRSLNHAKLHNTLKNPLQNTAKTFRAKHCCCWQSILRCPPFFFPVVHL